MTAIRQASYPPGTAGERAFWLGRPADADNFDEASEVYGEPRRFVPAPGVVRSRWPERCGFAVAGLIVGALLSVAAAALNPPLPCDLTALNSLMQWKPDAGLVQRSAQGRMR